MKNGSLPCNQSKGSARRVPSAEEISRQERKEAREEALKLRDVLEREIQKTLTPKELKSRRGLLERRRREFALQDGYRDWCGDRYEQAKAVGCPQVAGTFTVRPDRLKGTYHAVACVRTWAKKFERYVLGRRGDRAVRLEVHIACEKHVSGELHIHIWLPSLPRWFRLTEWREAMERWWPLAEESGASLTGVLGVRFRIVKSKRQARYHGKYLAKDLREGGPGIEIIGHPFHGMLFDVGRRATGADLASADQLGGAPASQDEP